MPETQGILIDAPEASCRMPAALTWKILCTVDIARTVGIHVNNTLTVASGFRLAVIKSGVAYVDGDPPPQYACIYGGVAANTSTVIEPNGMGVDVIPLTLNTGDRIVGYVDNVGVTFLPQGFGFS